VNKQKFKLQGGMKNTRKISNTRVFVRSFFFCLILPFLWCSFFLRRIVAVAKQRYVCDIPPNLFGFLRAEATCLLPVLSQQPAVNLSCSAIKVIFLLVGT